MPRPADGQQPADDTTWATPNEQRAVILLVIVYWMVFQILFYIHLALGVWGQEQSIRAFVTGVASYIAQPSEMVIALAGGALCYAMYATLRRTRHLSFWQQLPVAAAVTAVGAGIFSLVVRVTLYAFSIPQPLATSRYIIVDIARWVPALGLWTVIALALFYNSEIKDRERRLSQLRAQAHEAQVRALRYQVNPHFLYNTLNSISGLILVGEGESADAMVMRLSRFYRASLAVDPLRDVSLADEFALQRLYLDIEKVRFADTLTIDVDLPPHLEAAQVPSLILQPLVENALKHGLNAVGTPTTLSVAAREVGGNLQLLVTDNGPGSSRRHGTGTGLSNVRQRLVARFGAKASLEAGSLPGRGFSVRLSMPLRFA